MVEVAAPHEPVDLDAGHESRPGVHIAPAGRQPLQDSSVVYGLVCNGAAALVAMAAAFAAARRRRRDLTRGITDAQVLQLPRRTLDHPLRRAA